MATFVNDTFTDTSATDLTAHTGETGATWTEHTTYTSGQVVISNANRIRNNQNQLCVLYASGAPINADYYVQASLVVKNVGGESNAGVAGRIDTAANTMYGVRYSMTSGTPQWILFKIVAGVVTSLGTFNETLADESSTVLKLEMIGSSIKLFLGGVERIAATDSAISAAGKAGVSFRQANAVTDTVGQHLDDFSAVDIVSSGGRASLTLPKLIRSPLLGGLYR